MGRKRKLSLFRDKHRAALEKEKEEEQKKAERRKRRAAKQKPISSKAPVSLKSLDWAVDAVIADTNAAARDDAKGKRKRSMDTDEHSGEEDAIVAPEKRRRTRAPGEGNAVVSMTKALLSQATVDAAGNIHIPKYYIPAGAATGDDGDEAPSLIDVDSFNFGGAISMDTSDKEKRKKRQLRLLSAEEKQQSRTRARRVPKSIRKRLKKEAKKARMVADDE